MAWYDRPYSQDEESHYHGSGLRALSVTTTIIVANAIVAFLTFSRSPLSERLFAFGVLLPGAVLHGEIWRLFTATYMHANLNHILFNMLGLYFLGPPLEQVWGRRQFFLVYTIGGVAGNVLLTLAGAVGFIRPNIYGLGASGSVLTLLGAAAVLFPQAQVYVYFFFPMRIRTVALLYGAWYAYNVWRQGSNYGGDMCHIAGLVVGVGWAYMGGISLSGRHHPRAHSGSLLGGVLRRRGAGGAGGVPAPGEWPGGWRVSNPGPSYGDEATLDPILAKIHAHGLDSLTVAEREYLKAAMERRRASGQ